jgi:hypothetical protein
MHYRLAWSVSSTIRAACALAALPFSCAIAAPGSAASFPPKSNLLVGNGRRVATTCNDCCNPSDTPQVVVAIANARALGWHWHQGKIDRSYNPSCVPRNRVTF